MPSRDRNWGRRRGHEYTVDGRNYVVWIAAERIDQEGIADIRITIRAQELRSICMIRGLKNLHYWMSYGRIGGPPIEEIAITPRVVCRLIAWAHDSGWDPVDSKSNLNLEVSQEEARLLLAGPAADEPTDAG